MQMTEIMEKKEAKARPLEEIEKVEKEKKRTTSCSRSSSSSDVVGRSSSSSSFDREYEVLTIRDRLKSSRGSRFDLIAKELGLNDGWKKKFSRRALLHGSVIDPNNRLYRIWIKFILLSWAVYSSFFTPMEFGFFRGLPENLFILDIIGQLVFLVDIVLQFFVAYRDKQTYHMVYKRTHIALRYLKSTFIIDLLACMPWDLIYKACGRKEEVRFLLWIRLYRAKRVMNFFQNLEKDIRVNYIIARIVKLIAVELYCTHTAACIFYYLATTLPESEEGYTWIGSLKLGDYSYSKFREIDLWKRYTTSLYFAIVTMATVGYGDIHAINLREMIFVMAYVSFDMVLGAYLIGNMTALIVKGSKTEKFRDKMTDLLKYMNRNRLGRDIREQTKGHVRLQFESSYTDASVLQDIPISIRSKISQTLYLPYIQEVSLFRGCSSEFLNQIVTRLHEEFFLPGEIIMEQGNVVDQLYFVCDGMLEEIGTAEDGSEETISLLQPNSSFGEISILCNIAQPYTVRVCELCRVLRLDKQSFSNIIDIYFYDGKKVLDNLLEGKESFRDKQLESDITFHIGKLEAELALKVNKASFDGNLDHLKSLIRAGADPSKTDYDGRTPLHLAAYRGHTDIILFLIQEGADINIKDNFGNTPLLEAVMNGHDRIASLLIREGASMKIENGGSFLCTAVAKGDLKYVKMLLSNGMDPNETDYDGRSPLHLAARKGYEDILLFLIEKGADINIKDNFGNTPLFEAVKNRHDKVASLLVREGASMEIENGGSFLCTAVSKGDSDYVKRLLSNGMDPNKTDYDGRSPLHVAARKGYEDIIVLLIQEGVDINIKDNFGNTPLLEAVNNGHDRIASLLVKEGGSMKIENAGSFLCTIVAKGDSEYLTRLLSNGMDPNLKDYDYRTPLHVAAAEGLIFMAKLLLDAGASIFTKDRWGNTPLDDARMSGNKNLIKLLEDAKSAQLSEFPCSPEFTDKLHQKKCTVYPFHPWDPKEHKGNGIELWVPETIEELIKTAIFSDSCILSEDAGKITDVSMIKDDQRLYLVRQTVH